MTRSRRALLRLGAAAALAGLAGCEAREGTTAVDEPYSPTGEPTPEPTPTPRDGDWQSYRGDAGNTGTGDSGPTTAPTVAWSRPTAVTTGGPSAAGGGIAVVPAAADTVYARRLSDGRLAWIDSAPVDPAVCPAATPSAAVVTDGSRVTALSPDDGDPLWRRGFGASVVGLTAVGERVLVATADGVLALTAATGERRWRAAPEGTVETAAAPGDPVAVGVRREGEPAVAAVGSEGTAWRRPFPGAAPDDGRQSGLWRPAVGDGSVAVAGGDTLVSLSATDGRLEWQTTTPAPVAAPPAVGRFGVAATSLETDLSSSPGDRTAAGSDTPTPPPTDVIRLRVTLSAHRSDDGRRRWRRRYRGTWNFTSGPPSTVPFRATADRLLLGVDGTLHAVGPGGERQWTAPVAGTPAVADGVVTAGDTAVGLADGERRWRATGDAGGVAVTPAVVGNRVYVGGADGVVSALAADTGRVEWRTQLDGAVGGTPAVTAADDGRRLVIVGTRAGSAVGLAADTGRVVWRRSVGGTPRSPTVADGRVFLGTFSETLTVLSATTGETLWTATRPEPFLPGVPTVGDGAVVAGANGQLYAFETADGSERWRVTGDDYRVQSTAAVGDGRVVLSLGSSLRAFRLADGTELWRHPSGSTNVAPAVHDGTAYTVADGRLTAVSVADGRRRWSRTVGNATSVTATPECLIVRGLDTRSLRGFSHDGDPLWRYDGRVATDPAATDGWLFAGAAGGRVLALVEADGRPSV
ncbi:PQQ-binding-like beta-propeller repeat protein [Halobaculum sp. MBLA0143]|uniref:outer membrane protein assembly factor BamB family protein n=1 Tax=Halobaculum sp. MBLA0143 TaxID=3079933 RepID=UPI0035260199